MRIPISVRLRQELRFCVPLRFSKRLCEGPDNARNKKSVFPVIEPTEIKMQGVQERGEVYLGDADGGEERESVTK